MIFKDEFDSGDLRIRRIRCTEPGDQIPEHTHNFDHTTIIHTGKFLVRARLPNGTQLEREFTAPAHALITADAMHEITCIEPGEVWCTFCHRDPVTGKTVKDANGWGAAYV